MDEDGADDKIGRLEDFFDVVFVAVEGVDPASENVVEEGQTPGVDVETWFGKRFKELGGTVTANLRVPLANPDFSPFLQRVADA